MSVPSSVDRASYAPCGFLEDRDWIASEVVNRQLAQDLDSKARYGVEGRRKCTEDARYHIVYLAEAVAAGSSELFRNYTVWLAGLLASLGIPKKDLIAQFEVLREVILERDHSEASLRGSHYLEQVLTELPNLAVEPCTHLQAEAGQTDLAQSVLDSLLRCERARALQLVDAAMASGMTLQTLYLSVLQPILREVGRLWQMNRISVAQEHYCTAVVQLMMGRLSELTFASERIGRTVVASCVGDELHEVGLRMVADLLEAAGWDSHFLGANVPPNDLIRTLKSTGADVLCLSATLTSHLARTHQVIQRVRAEPELQRVKIVVGGYPFNLEKDLWQRFGADGYAADGRVAVEVCTRLVGQ